jgi:hypothetical protein
MAADSYTQSDGSISAGMTPETEDTSFSSTPENGLQLSKSLPDTLGRHLNELYSNNISAKVLRAAIDCLRNNVSPSLTLQAFK